MAEQCGRAPRRQCGLGHLSAGVECKYGELPDFGPQRRPGRASSDLYPVAFFHSDGTEAKRGKEVGRRRCFETVGSVVSLPESTTSGSGKTNIEEDTAPRKHFGGVGNPLPPADLPVQGGRKATFANQSRGVDVLAESL